MTTKIDDIVSFTYKGGRKVKGRVLLVNKNNLRLILHTDYIGKNEEWYEGEKKDFNISEIKNFKIIQP